MAPSDAPLVSVIVPAYQAAASIEATLASALAQTYPHLEVLVVDDGSTDATPALVEAIARADARVRLLRQPNAGVASARNAAIETASGALIAPLDADDLWHPDKLRRQVTRLQEVGPSVGVVYTDYQIVAVSDGRVLHPPPHALPEGDLSDVLVYRNPLPCASIPLIRRTALDRAGRYDPTLQAQGAQGCEDWDLYLRLSEHTEFAVVRENLVTYRRGEGSMSAHPERMRASYAVMMRRLRQRRPDVAPALLARSRLRFHLYLAGIYRQHRRAAAAAREVAAAVLQGVRWRLYAWKTPYPLRKLIKW